MKVAGRALDLKDACAATKEAQTHLFGF